MAKDALVFDGHDLNGLARDVRAAAESLRRETDVTLVKVGGEIVAAAKELAGAHSQTVAGTVKMKAIPGAVVISGGSSDVPIAALWEMGNKGSKVSATTFRHPVFGQTGTWVEQPKFPYLRPALRADRRHITQQMERTWDKALQPHRLRPSGGGVI